MSGGAYNYVYCKLQDAAQCTRDKEIEMLLDDLADLMKSEEWYVSGDTSYEEWDEDRKAFKEKWFKGAREERLKEIIEREFNRVKREMEDML